MAKKTKSRATSIAEWDSQQLEPQVLILAVKADPGALRGTQHDVATVIHSAGIYAEQKGFERITGPSAFSVEEFEFIASAITAAERLRSERLS